ncbi:MAG: DUF2169 domain-containing protein [Myxococcales bacterium]|nr:DUF2169 domain-containing protein [Myxococcales bacterium]
MSKVTPARAAAIHTTSDGGPAAHAFAFAFPWRQQRVLSVCVVVKLAYALGADGQLAPTAAAPVDPADLTPYREAVDLVFAGPVRAGAGSARLALLRADAALVDKRVPRTAGREGAALAPLPPHDPARAAWLRGQPPPALANGILELGAELDRRFFQSAPPDQRVAELAAGDQLLLEGLHAGSERVLADVPTVAPVVVATLGQASHTVAMRCDELLVDGARERCELTWRGSFTVPDVQSLPLLRVHVRAPTAATTRDARPAASVAPNATVALVDGAPVTAPAQQPAWLGGARPAGGAGAAGGLPAALLRKLQKARPVEPAIASKPAPAAAPAQGPGSGTAFFVAGSGPAPLPFAEAPAGKKARFDGTMAIDGDQPSAATTPFAPTPVARERATEPAKKPALPGAPWAGPGGALPVVPPAESGLDITVGLGSGIASPAAVKSPAARPPEPTPTPTPEPVPAARASEPGRASEPERPPEPKPPARASDPGASPWREDTAAAPPAPEVKAPPRVRPDVKSALRKKFGR